MSPGRPEDRDPSGPERPPLPDETRAHSLAALSKAVTGLNAVDQLMAWSAVLRTDSRRGARQIADRLDRRRSALVDDAERVAALFEFRTELHGRGLAHVAGIDEVGVGPLAGPVVAAAVVLPDRVNLPGLDDSKKLSAATRERLALAIHEQALAVGIGEVSPTEIDQQNIRRASLEAMRRAFEKLLTRVRVDHVMVDAHRIPGLTIPQTPLTHGDAIDGSIAAASIVAKVHRDAMMRVYAFEHPGYGFERHMGYGTQEHLEALGRLGVSPIHRRSFAPVASVLGR